MVLEFHAESSGEQYDRISGLWLGGVELLRTSTAEPTPCGIFWKVRKDVTRYSSLLSQNGLNVSMMLENVVNREYTGVYHIHVNLVFYTNTSVSVPLILNRTSKLGFVNSQINLGDDNGVMVRGSSGLFGQEYQSPADLIIPVSDNGDRGFWFRIDSESDIHYKNIRIPRNTRRLMLELYVSFHGNDEFWYSNPPSSYITTNNLTTGRGNSAYREVYFTIDGNYAGSEVPFPVIFTGGINPLFWEPVVAIGAFNLPSYDFDLTPFLGLLVDGKSHQIGIGVTSGISFWLVDANLHLWLDHVWPKVVANSVVYSSPSLSIRRREQFKLLDGLFQIKAKRSSKFSGWVFSSAGNFTHTVSQEFKMTSLVKFTNNGTYKVAQQRVKSEKDMRLKTELGASIIRVNTKRKYPLDVITRTLPGFSGEDTYLLITNVSHALNERHFVGGVLCNVHNSQSSSGWMEIRDHSVLSGESRTNQSYSYGDEFICYNRDVAALNGRLIEDNSTFLCSSSI